MVNAVENTREFIWMAIICFEMFGILGPLCVCCITKQKPQKKAEAANEMKVKRITGHKLEYLRFSLTCLHHLKFYRTPIYSIQPEHGQTDIIQRNIVNFAVFSHLHIFHPNLNQQESA